MNFIKKIICYIINLFFTGVIPFLIISNIINLFLNGKFIFIKNYNIKSFFSLVIMALFVKYTLQGFEGLYYEYKDWYNESGLLGKIIMFLGLGFVVYGVYYRAKMSGTFK